MASLCHPPDSMPPSPMEASDLFWTSNSGFGERDGSSRTGKAHEDVSEETELSLLERTVTAYPPIMDSLFSQLPTSSLISLFHTSTYLRRFLSSYPLAWKTLSFRLPQPAVTLGSPGVDTPEGRGQQTKQYSLDGMLFDVIIPLATTLRNLDLCNTAISGTELVSVVLTPQAQTIQHLSVRGCKNVSIKYQIVPWLQMHLPRDIRRSQRKLALRSLYVYRCRHHRRRPYLPSSLQRRDSDSEPTHDLIELCHLLGIWTDTAWCPTPGGRCFRRKDYHNNRAAPGTFEVWVPFDRLWRSSNRIGPAEDSPGHKRSDGRLWEDAETGHDGEALGTGSGGPQGEGKDIPAHLRRSHRTFVDNIKCHDCGDPILERCETCSIKMHCMGCRKTLCASCAFDRPLPRRRLKIQHVSRSDAADFSRSSAVQMNANDSRMLTSTSTARSRMRPHKRSRFWWAPGASRSPNLLAETSTEDYSSDSDDTIPAPSSHSAVETSTTAPPRLNMNWCCLEPIFSGGGGVAFLGPSLTGLGQDRIRAVPLPKCEEYEDSDFVIPSALTTSSISNHLKNLQLYESIMGDSINIYPFLSQQSQDVQARTCPRSLCRDCYTSFRWRVPCRGCKKPLCKEHDFRALKVRKCGYRDLSVEREHVQRPPVESFYNSHSQLRIPAFGEAKQSRVDRRLAMAQATRQSTEQSPAHISRTSPVPPGEGPRSEFSTPHIVPVSLPSFPAGINLGSMETFVDMADPPAASNLAEHIVTPIFVPSPSSSGPTPSQQAPRCVRPPHALVENSKRHLHRSNSLSSLRDTVKSEQVHPIAAQAGCKTPSMIDPCLPLPCHPEHPVQWLGCGAYFCPSSRPVGDLRPRCSLPNALRECGECGVYVCEFCVPTSAQACPCSHCKTVFHCPYCATKPSVLAQCQRAAELKAADDMRKAQEHLRRQRDEQVRLLARTLKEGGLARRPFPLGSSTGLPDSHMESDFGEQSSRSSGIMETLEVIEGLDPSSISRALPIPPEIPRPTGYSISPSVAASMIANGIATSSSSSNLTFAADDVLHAASFALPVFAGAEDDVHPNPASLTYVQATSPPHSPVVRTMSVISGHGVAAPPSTNSFLSAHGSTSGSTSRAVSGGSLESLMELTRAESQEREIEDRIDREIALELRALPSIPMTSEQRG